MIIRARKVTDKDAEIAIIYLIETQNSQHVSQIDQIKIQYGKISVM